VNLSGPDQLQAKVDKKDDGESQVITRIVHITTAHDPRDIRIFRKQCRSLQREFADVHIVAPAHESFVEDGVTIHAVRRPRSRAARFLLTLPRVVSVARKLNADLYHLHDPDLLLVAPILRRDGRVVFDSHEDYPRDLMSRPYLQNVIGRWVVRMYAFLEGRIFRRIDAVITVNRSMTERIRRIQKTTLAVYNFPIAAELPQPVAEPTYADKVIWLGLLNAARGVSTLSDASKSLPPKTIHVIGRCDDLQAADSRLTLLGAMAYEDAVNRAANYAAGLATFPSNDFHRDMFPIKLFEYMLMGLPIIASRFPKWERLIGDANCAVFVDPDSAPEVSSAVQWILDNSVAAREMGQRGRKLALEKYCWSSEARKLVVLYRHLLGCGTEAGGLESIEDFETAGTAA
jgi:glycosyltransferase involved in cell wall biosynthesis